MRVADYVKSLPRGFPGAWWSKPQSITGTSQAIDGKLDAIIGSEIFIYRDVNKPALARVLCWC
jgi:hypothetical protein